MNIKLTDSWYIKSDSMNIMLVEVVNERDYIQGYFSTLKGCLEAYIQLKIKKSEASNVQELINYIKALTTALNEALTPLEIKVEVPNKLNSDRGSNA
jgi:hypothetical protein